MFYNDHNMALQIAPRLTTSNSTPTITTLAGGDAGQVATDPSIQFTFNQYGLNLTNNTIVYLWRLQPDIKYIIMY